MKEYVYYCPELDTLFLANEKRGNKNYLKFKFDPLNGDREFIIYYIGML